MVRIVVIGGSGHIGTYLIPLLVARRYDVVNVSRGSAKPYIPHPAWERVQQISLDRKAAEAEGTFVSRIVDLKPDIVVDNLSYELNSAKALVDALRGKVELYLFCSTMWVYGHTTTVPATEDEYPEPIDDYGRKKAQIEEYIMRLARMEGFPATSFRPGHIVGRGWVPINPQGNQNLEAFKTIAAGRELTLPNLGLETLHHIHSDDIARWILLAIDNRAACVGECFNLVSAQAVTLRGLAEGMYRYFNQTPRLAFLAHEQFASTVSEADAQATLTHITHSPCGSVEKSRQRLGWTPRYSSLEAMQESVEDLVKEGQLVV